MKVAYITAGAAGMYCGTCLHDNTLAKAMIRRGHDVALIPLYTPIRTDEENVSIDRVFYGAVNVYLEQKSALFRHTPWLVDRMLNSRGLLDWATRHGASSTDARNLGPLTLSVLEGEDGNQRKELERLTAWLADEYRPDIVHLSNSMMAGFARRIRERVGCPVVCSVQGEDLFLDQLDAPHVTLVRRKLRECVADVDGFIATSRYYADYMADLLEVAPGRMHQVKLGVSLDGFGEGRAAARGDVAGRPFVVGYLARLCPEKGLHLLVEAFRRFAEAAGRDAVRLEIAGYLDGRDRDYFAGVMEQIAGWGLADVVRYAGEIDRREKIEFLRALDVLSVPTIYREPKGLFVLEAWASEVPVVQPRHGAFPEMVETSGGGLLVEPGSVEALADAFARLRADPEARREMGRRGREAVHRDYADATMAEETLKVYARYARDRGPM